MGLPSRKNCAVPSIRKETRSRSGRISNCFGVSDRVPPPGAGTSTRSYPFRASPMLVSTVMAVSSAVSARVGGGPLQYRRVAPLVLRERLQLGPPLRHDPHVLLAAPAGEDEERDAEHDPEGVLQEPPPLRVGDAVHRLGPEDPAEEVIGRHHHGACDQDGPVPI